jgi:hypothetical protein
MISSSSVGCGVSVVVLDEEDRLVVEVLSVVSPPTAVLVDVELPFDVDEDDLLLVLAWVCPGTVALDVAVAATTR